MEQNLEPIRSKIYEIRGQRVMLDRDLAELYGVETRERKSGTLPDPLLQAISLMTRRVHMMSKNAFWCRDFPFDVCKDITIGKDYYEHPDSF